MVDAEYYRNLADPALASRRWIILSEAAAAATLSVQYLSSIGAPRPFVLAGSPGTGDLPDPEKAEMAILGSAGGSIMEGFRAYFAAVADLPAEVRERIDEWDPDHTAMALATGLDPDTPIHGRPTWAGRPAAWMAVEDKTTVDALWDDAGVERAPSEVVPASLADLQAAAGKLDSGAGTVWVGDNREGWHGGGEYARLVADPTAAGEAAVFMTEHCDTVRVMPFLEGVPCSIHATVFPEGEYAYRPCEMLVYRRPGSPVFLYAGVATWWEPSAADGEEMRAAALRVAALLRQRIGYRGALGIDGVMTADGFRPTELNPRHSIGLGLQGLGQDPPIPMASINRMLVAGEDVDYRSAELNRLVLENAAGHPQMRSLTPIDRAVDETTTVPIQVVGSEVRAAPKDEVHGTLKMGPATMGGVVMLHIDPEHATVGPSAAPVAASAFRLADDLWDTGIGELKPADELR